MDLGELLEILEPIVVYTFITTVLPYFIACLANAFIFSLAPAFRTLIKKMKESNEHGDSTSEFRNLNGSKMKMLYQSQTIFYLKYMDECSELGIGTWAKQKQQTLQQPQARQMVQVQQRSQSQSMPQNHT